MPTSLVPLFPGLPGGPEMIVILLIVVLLFGANKLPKLARSSGQAMGEFKKGREEIEDELQDMRGDDSFDDDDSFNDDKDDDSFSNEGGFEQANQGQQQNQQQRSQNQNQRSQGQQQRSQNQRSQGQPQRSQNQNQRSGQSNAGGWGTSTERERDRR